MDGRTLGRKLWEAIRRSTEEGKGSDAGKQWEAVGEAFCDYLREHAEVLPGIPVVTSGGNGSTSEAGKLR